MVRVQGRQVVGGAGSGVRSSFCCPEMEQVVSDRRTTSAKERTAFDTVHSEVCCVGRMVIGFRSRDRETRSVSSRTKKNCCCDDFFLK